MASAWFYAKNGKETGPLSVPELQTLVESGQILPTTLVRRDDMTKWVPAAKVRGLFPSISPASPPPTKSAPASPSASPLAETGKTIPPPVAKENVAPPVATEKAAGEIMPSSPPKDPILMGVLSFIIPWLGHIILGQTAKGIAMLLLTPFILAALFLVTFGAWGLLVMPVLYLIAAIDAFLLARKLKLGHPIGNWEFFGLIAPRPPGLIPCSVLMLFVSGIALSMSLFGMVAVILEGPGGVDVHVQILIVLSLFQNAFVIFACIQTVQLKRYAIAITAPIMVMASWYWFFFTHIPFALPLIGTLAGIPAGIWAMSVLRKPKTKAAFEKQTDPLGRLLPMTEASPSLFTQLSSNKVVLAVGCVFLLLLLTTPFLSLVRFTSGSNPNVATNNPTNSEKKPVTTTISAADLAQAAKADPEATFSKYGNKVVRIKGIVKVKNDGWNTVILHGTVLCYFNKSSTQVEDLRSGQEVVIMGRYGAGRGVDEYLQGAVLGDCSVEGAGDVDEKPSKSRDTKTIARKGDEKESKGGTSGGDDYQEGYKAGHDAAKALVDLHRATNTPLDRAELDRQVEAYKRLNNNLPGNKAKELVRGYYDGVQDALAGR